MKINKIFISMLLLAFVLSSCEEDFLETAPTDSLEAGTMFESLEGANAALNGMYRFLYAFEPEFGTNHHGFGHMSTNMDLSLMGQHMVGNVLAHGWFSQQYAWRTHRNADAGVTHLRWFIYYKMILNANMIIHNAPNIEGALPSDINRVKAQGLAARGFGYYMLVQMFAPAYHVNPNAPAVPLLIEQADEGQPRETLGKVYDQIYADLTQAIELYGGSTAQQHKSHISLPVAHGLMARTALARHDFALARDHASMAIDLFPGNLFTPGDYPPPFQGTFAGWPRNQLFNSVSASEWMWGMEINEEQATIFASFFSHIDPTIFGYAQLGNQKLISSGENGLYHRMSETDVRRNLFVDPEYGVSYMVPYVQVKFIVPTVGSWESDYVFMRLAEMYLIKAEAQARLGQDGPAAETLHELIQNRDPEYALSANTGDDLIEEIMFHRAVELWGEGFDFIDLKRTGAPLNRVEKGHSPGLAILMEYPADGIEWMWLIPTDEIDANDAISSGDQNPQ